MTVYGYVTTYRVYMKVHVFTHIDAHIHLQTYAHIPKQIDTYTQTDRHTNINTNTNTNKRTNTNTNTNQASYPSYPSDLQCQTKHNMIGLLNIIKKDIMQVSLKYPSVLFYMCYYYSVLQPVM